MGDKPIRIDDLIEVLQEEKKRRGNVPIWFETPREKTTSVHVFSHVGSGPYLDTTNVTLVLK